MGVGRSVLQDWVHGLTFMQQSVLIATVRGPDTIRKNHVAKLLLRWLRRCIMLSAFEGSVLQNPVCLGGGSFTGPSLPFGPGGALRLDYWSKAMDDLVSQYLGTVDELPHHFQLHFMHAAEILGYKHPDIDIARFWHTVYLRLVNDMHLYPEPEAVMDIRLGDREPDWRAAEEVVAESPTTK